MTDREYMELMGFLHKKLKYHRETGLSGNRAEGYEMGIRSCMSKVREIYKRSQLFDVDPK